MYNKLEILQFCVIIVLIQMNLVSILVIVYIQYFFFCLKIKAMMTLTHHYTALNSQVL